MATSSIEAHAARLTHSSISPDCGRGALESGTAGLTGSAANVGCSSLEAQAAYAQSSANAT